MTNSLNAKELKGMIGLYEKTLNTEKNTIKMIEETIELNKKSVEIIKKELDICERLCRSYHVSGLRNKKYREKEEKEFRRIIELEMELYTFEENIRNDEKTMKNIVMRMENRKAELDTLRKREAELAA